MSRTIHSTEFPEALDTPALTRQTTLRCQGSDTGVDNGPAFIETTRDSAARTVGSSQCGSTGVWRGCPATLIPAALPLAAQRGHAGAATAIGVMQARGAAAADDSFHRPASRGVHERNGDDPAVQRRRRQLVLRHGPMHRSTRRGLLHPPDRAIVDRLGIASAIRATALGGDAIAGASASRTCKP
jgi:hypothetical protein